MTTRITLDLPDSLMERIAETSRRLERSSEQVILALLEADASISTEQPRAAAAQSERAPNDPPYPIPSDEEMERFADQMIEIWEDDDDGPLPTHEELRAMMPILDPPLSQTVMDMREDRF